MKAHRIEIIVVDPNETYTLEDIRHEIERMDPIVHFIEEDTKEIGEWSDEHPLNFDSVRALDYWLNGR